jgi:hypothetical protein
MGGQRESTQDLAGVEAQARDISFLIGYAGTLADADLAYTAVMGFSWDGLANVVAAARDTRIAALFSLDGSLRYWAGLIAQASDDGVPTHTLKIDIRHAQPLALSFADFKAEVARRGFAHASEVHTEVESLTRS